MESKEIWRDCKGYEGKYQVSNLGRVWSVGRQIYLRQNINCHGYYSVMLYSKNGKAKRESVHRLVALAFLENPNNYPCVNHKDEIRTNNNVDNLEWCTYKYNSNYGSCQEKHSQSRGNTVYQYDLNMQLVNTYNSLRRAEEATHHDRDRISKACKTKKAFAGYYWRFEEVV